MTDTIIEKDTILVTIGEDHSFNCSVVTIGRTGENAVSQLEIEIPKELASFDAFLEFKKPKGQTTRTPKITVQDNRIEYDIPQSLLDENGNIEVQLILQGENGEIWKSATKKYVVLKSIDAGEDIPQEQKEDFFTEAQRTMDTLASVCAPAIKETVVGSAVSMTDVSPLEHEIKVKLSYTPQATETEILMEGVEPSVWDMENGDYLVTGKTEEDGAMGCAAFDYKYKGMTCSVFYVENYYDSCTVGVDFIRVKQNNGIPVFYLVKVSDPTKAYDYNEDGVLDEADALYLLNHFHFSDRYPIPSGKIIDVDGNGTFELNDTVTLEKLVNCSTVTLTKYGKNLIKYPYYQNKVNTVNGVTFTVNEDGTVVANGTSSGFASILLEMGNSGLVLKKGVTYTISGVEFSSQYAIALASESKTLLSTVNANSNRFTPTEDTPVATIRCIVYSGTVADNLVFKPQLEIGTTATEYEPYKAETVSVNSDGTASIVCKGESITLMTDSDDVTITAEYNVDTKKYIDKKLAQLVASAVSEGVV